MEKLGYLRESDFFSGLSVSELEGIGQHLRMSEFPKGTIIYEPNQRGEVLFILKRGRVRIYRVGQDGRQLTISELGAGTIFGEMALLGQTMYGSFAEALDDCSICDIDRKAVLELLREKPELAVRLIELMGRRLQAAENRMESLGLRDVPRRLATLLIELADGSSDGKLGRPYTHAELAKMIGASRESVTVTLGDFRAREWVALDDHRISIIQPEGLRRFIGA